MTVTDTETSAARDGRGRFQPGASGNPAGKKPGTRNRASRIRELLDDGDVDTAVQVLRDKLHAGDGVAARFILDRLFPKPRDREIDLGLPPPEDGTTLADVLDRVVWLMASGEITIDEASRITRLAHQRHMAPAARPSRGAGSPAFGLQTAGEAAATEAGSPPANRHERRRAEALQRAAHAAAGPRNGTVVNLGELGQAGAAR